MARVIKVNDEFVFIADNDQSVQKIPRVGLLDTNFIVGDEVDVYQVDGEFIVNRVMPKVALPQLTGRTTQPKIKVDNTIVWILAFAPLIGLFLEVFFLALMYGGNEYQIIKRLENNELWFVTLILNIVLSFLDELRLRKVGVDTNKFKAITFLIPGYLYLRAKSLGDNQMIYFWVWIATFILTLLA